MGRSYAFESRPGAISLNCSGPATLPIGSFPGLRVAAEEIGVGFGYAGLEVGGGGPSEVPKSGRIHKFAGRAVGFGTVPIDLALEVDGLFNEFGEASDGDFGPGADIDVRLHRSGIVGKREVVIGDVFHQENAGFGEVIAVEEFAQGGAGSPADDAVESGCFGLVKTADHGGQDVGVFGVVVVAGAVHVGGHGGDEVGAVLAVVGIAQADAGNFGDGVGLVGGFKRAGQQGGLGEGLGRHTGIDAGGAEEEELFRAVLIGGMHEVGLDHEVFVEELCAVDVVRIDAADFGRNDDDIFRPFLGEKAVHRRLVDQVELRVGAAEQADETVRFKGPPDGGTHEAAVAGHIYLCIFVHGGFPG